MLFGHSPFVEVDSQQRRLKAEYSLLESHVAQAKFSFPHDVPISLEAANFIVARPICTACTALYRTVPHCTALRCIVARPICTAPYTVSPHRILST